MARYRQGIQYPSFNLVQFALECPKHPGIIALENPVGQNAIFDIAASGNTAHVTYESQRLFCPQGGGHTFNVEDCNATIYNSNGTIAASGVPVNGQISPSGLAIGSIYLG